jgi:Fe-S-cluster containining protein
VIRIPEPKDEKDFDHIKWLLLHKGVSIYVDDKDKSWNVQIGTKCNNLDKDSKRQDYKNRPDVCREYRFDECERYKE